MFVRFSSLLLFLLRCLLLLLARWLRCGGLLAGVVERFVDFAGSPEAMEQHGQFPCDGNDGSLLRVAPATSCDQQAVPAQIAVRSERTEDVLRASDQQARAE